MGRGNHITIQVDPFVKERLSLSAHFGRNPLLMRRIVIHGFTLLCLVMAGIPNCFATEGGLLQAGVTGQAPSEPARNPTAMLRSETVQRLMLDLSERPQTKAEIAAALGDQPFTVDDMVAVGLLREQDGEYWIDFNLLRVEDQLRILEVSEPFGRQLASAVLEHRNELEAIAQGHNQPGQDLSAEFLYFVLGCFSLDWDGLDLTEEKGWRLGAQRQIDDDAFTPWAKEQGAGISRRGFYWGSHNAEVEGVKLTTFGDHHSLPRFALPDLFWRNATSFRGYDELEEETRAANRMFAVYEPDISADVARVMMELGSRAQEVETLSAGTGIDRTKLEPILAFLEAAEYIEPAGDAWQAKALVLQAEDAERVAAMVGLGREIMLAWHEEHYESIRESLADLTPLRNGVPFERVYTEIWHFVFGFANRILVEEGLFADPYGEGRRYQGFLPLVWDASLGESP